MAEEITIKKMWANILIVVISGCILGMLTILGGNVYKGAVVTSETTKATADTVKAACAGNTARVEDLEDTVKELLEIVRALDARTNLITIAATDNGGHSIPKRVLDTVSLKPLWEPVEEPVVEPVAILPPATKKPVPTNIVRKAHPAQYEQQMDMQIQQQVQQSWK